MNNWCTHEVGFMKNLKFVHCLFEQSGTFKREFKKLGIGAFDYDLKDDFKETDLQKDLFAEISKAYAGYSSIFDLFDSKDDLLIAFFPCTRFDIEILMHILGNANQMQNWTDDKKVENSMRLMEEVFSFYQLFCKMVLVCYRKGLRLIVENPYRGTAHFLTRYFPIRPAIVDMDRSKFGDDFKKPTQYWFFNCEPVNHIDFGNDLPDNKPTKKVQECKQVERSMIGSDYASWFIKEFILDGSNS